eukprot:TRINITY_DN54529_c0_g1_i1.p1 TRINITY_DN54529_c0_g1~~TRINITY_DN54529_c0_g1_i1.p1  ORF type:complete len:211 (-),score=27.22 TRINITY_DN54529_c0_g1_i1:122-721(-)
MMPGKGSYGSAPPIQRVNTQRIRDDWDSGKSLIGEITCCVVSPVFLFGIIVAALSTTVPGTCTTALQSIFIDIGVVYMMFAVMLLFTATCIGGSVVDLLKHMAISSKYADEDRDAEAAKEVNESASELPNLLVACPCLFFLTLVLPVATVCFWIWGIVEAAQDSHGTCGSGPAVFYVLLAFTALSKCCCTCCVQRLISG